MMPLDSQTDLLELGVAMRQRRIDLGWTQAQLAAQVGCSQAALSMFEQAGRGLKFDKLLAALRALGLVMIVDERSNYEQTSA